MILGNRKALYDNSIDNSFEKGNKRGVNDIEKSPTKNRSFHYG